MAHTGPRAKEFRGGFARYVGAAHTVSVTPAPRRSTGPGALDSSASGVVVPLTFAATAEVITYFDARPVFVDVEPETCA